MNDPLVTVLCITYNQAEYIGKAVSSFLNQRTDFPYEILIHDDCSNDGTDRILRRLEEEHPDKLTVMTETENQLSRGVNIPFEIMLPHIRGKYIASCEGDDSWTDPDKLRLQAEFMEEHPDYMLCCHNGIRHNALTGETIQVNPFDMTGEVLPEQLLFCYKNNPPTASFMIRKDAVADLPEFFIHAPVFDDVVRLYCMTKGRIWYSDRVMCYREYMHRVSWNAKMEESMDLVRYYIYGMIDFYHRFDGYTDNKYHRYIEEIIGKNRRRILKQYRQTGADAGFLAVVDSEIDMLIQGDTTPLSSIIESRKQLFDKLWKQEDADK